MNTKFLLAILSLLSVDCFAGDAFVTREGMQFRHQGSPEVKDKSYQVSPASSPAVWKVLKQYVPRRNP